MANLLDTALIHSRQNVKVAIQDVTMAELTSGAAIGAVKVPYGARVVGGGVIVETAFDSGTSDVLDVGDGGDADRYSATPINIAAAGYTALDITGYKYTVTDFIDLTWTGAGTAATTGVLQLVVFYTIDGNQDAGIMPTYD